MQNSKDKIIDRELFHPTTWPSETLAAVTFEIDTSALSTFPFAYTVHKKMREKIKKRLWLNVDGKAARPSTTPTSTACLFFEKCLLKKKQCFPWLTRPCQAWLYDWFEVKTSDIGATFTHSLLLSNLSFFCSRSYEPRITIKSKPWLRKSYSGHVERRQARRQSHYIGTNELFIHNTARWQKFDYRALSMQF